MDFIYSHFNYYASAILFCVSLFLLIVTTNLPKKLFGLAIMQTSVMLLFISLGKVSGGKAPIILQDANYVYANPLPHVLILTAIVVGLATLSVGLALIIRINKFANKHDGGAIDG